jgi:Ca2+-binding RTX toxin-like protein
VVCLGTGDDAALGMDGDDTIFGEEDDDTINGGAGDDRLFGGPGADDLNGAGHVNGDVCFPGAGGNAPINCFP